MLWDPLSAWPAGRRWLWVGLAAIVGGLQGPAFVASLWPPEDGADFFQEWSSARNVLNGRPAYEDLEVATPRYVGRGLYKSGDLYVKYNAHPPASILLALPFGLLNYSTATLAWNLASLGALGASFWLVARGLGLSVPRWAIFPAVTLLLTCSPLRQHVNQGQLSLSLLLLITGAWAAERSGRPRLAGALIAVAAAIKLFPGFFMLYFLLRRRWSVLFGGVVGLVAITAASAAILGVGAHRDYLNVVLPEVSRFRYAWANASLTGFWGKVFGPGTWHYHRHILPLANWPAFARVGMLASTAAVLLLWGRKVWRARTQAECDAAFGLTLIAMLLLSPVVWDHYFVLMLLPLIQLWMGLPLSTPARYLRIGLLACLWVDQATLWEILLPESRTDHGSMWAPATLVVLLSYQCYTLLTLFGLHVGFLPADVAGRPAPQPEATNWPASAIEPRPDPSGVR